MLAAGSVKVDGEIAEAGLKLHKGKTYVCQAGKKQFAKVTLA